MAITYIYEVYIAGSLGVEEVYFYGDYALDGTPDPWVALTSGGVLSRTSDVAFDATMMVPNVLPAEKVSGRLGLEPSVSGGAIVDAHPWNQQGDPHFVIVGTGEGGADPIDSPLTYPDDVTYIKIRYFLKKFTVKVEWSDGTALEGRAVALRGSLYSFDRDGTAFVGEVVSSNLYSTQLIQSISFPAPLGYQRTDSSGVATYYANVGLAVGISDDNSTYYWGFDQPPVIGGNTQNVNMEVAEEENLRFVADEGHRYYQLNEPYDTPDEHTSTWAVDYSGYSGGMLTYSNASLQTHTYRQYGVVRVYDTHGYFTADIEFGTWSGASGDPIEAVPKGSLLNRYDMPDGDLFVTPTPADEPALLDASGYPSASVDKQQPQIATADNGFWNITDYTGKTGDKLTGASYRAYDYWNPVTQAPEPGLGVSLYNYHFGGGEVVTQFYDGTWTATDGSGRTGEFRIWIHEDQTVEIDLFIPAETGGGSLLDYCVDPHGLAWLTQATDTDVLQISSDDLEATMDTATILPDVVLSSPSRQVGRDHLHLLASVKDGKANLFSSQDADTWDTTPVLLDDDNIYLGATLRFDPAGILYCWLVTDHGDVKRRTSTDGGTTWDTLEDVTTLPTLQAERMDVRHDGERWLAACPKDDGSLHLYGAKDGETWEAEVEIAATGQSAALLALQGSLLCLFYDGTDWKSVRLSRTGSGWNVETAVTVEASVGDNGLAAFRNTRKVLAALVDDSDTLIYRRSKEEGDSWESASEG